MKPIETTESKHTPGPWLAQDEGHPNYESYQIHNGKEIICHNVTAKNKDLVLNAPETAAERDELKRIASANTVIQKRDGMSNIWNEGFNEGVCEVFRALETPVEISSIIEERDRLKEENEKLIQYARKVLDNFSELEVKFNKLQPLNGELVELLDWAYRVFIVNDLNTHPYNGKRRIEEVLQKAKEL